MKIENKKILILSPHQDDEILSCYQVIKDAEYSNNDLFIVYVTNGDYFGEQKMLCRVQKVLVYRLIP